MQDRRTSYEGQGARYKNIFLLFVFRFWIEKDRFPFPDQVEDRFHVCQRDGSFDTFCISGVRFE